MNSVIINTMKATLGMATLVVLGCGGCVAPDPPAPTSYEVHLLAPTTDQAVEAIGALTDWTTATGVQFRTQIDDASPCPDAAAPGAHTCVDIAFTDSSTAFDAECQDGSAGCSWHGHVVILTGHGWDEAHVLRHELGHTLGLNHDPSEDAVMYYSLAGSPTITARDVAAYWAVR